MLHITGIASAAESIPGIPEFIANAIRFDFGIPELLPIPEFLLIPNNS